MSSHTDRFTRHRLSSRRRRRSAGTNSDDVAVRTLTAVRDSQSITVLPVGPDTFDAAATQFAAYDDQEISFVDHTTAVLAADRDIDHVLTFDDDFRTLGFTVIPNDETLP